MKQQTVKIPPSHQSFSGTQKNQKSKRYSSGFTFIELIIVMSIFAVLSSVVMFNFTDFSSNVKLQNLVQDVALQVRQAQLSGSSGRIPPQSAYNLSILQDMANGVKPAYGVHFNISSSIDITTDPDTSFNTQFIYFFDIGLTPNGFYDVSTQSCDVTSFPQNECIDVLLLPPEFKISEIEVIDSTGVSYLATSGSFDSLDIVFTRPKLEASLVALDNGSILNTAGALVTAKITLESSRGQQRTISVSRIGQISAQ